jgi:phage terminase large subunit
VSRVKAPATRKKVAESVEAAFNWKKPDYEAIYRARAERLRRIRSDPSILPGLKAHYAGNPVDFITDWGMTFDPRNPELGLPAVVPFVLFPRQEEFIDWLEGLWRGRKDGLCEKSRDMGVTWLCVGFAVWMLLFHPGTVVGFGSRKEEYVDKIGDPKSIFWKIRQFMALLPVEFKPVGYIESRHAPHMRIINPENGSAIIGEAGDNIGRGNRTSIYLKDESAFYEHALAIDAALSQTSNCKVDLSTVNGAGNPFYEKRHGGRLKDDQIFIFDWREDPRKDEKWYAKQVASLDPVIVASEIDRNYEASVGDAFIPGPLVAAAQAKGPADVEARGPVIISVDVARFGNNKSVVTARKGRVVLFQRKYQGLNTQDLIGRVKVEVDAIGVANVGQIAVDVIGVGAGVADGLRALFPATGKAKSIVVDVNAALRVDDGRNYNLRAQMYEAALDWLAMQPCSIPNDPELKAQLTAIKYHFRGGLRLLESKEDMERRGIQSPDCADSFAIGFAVPVVVTQRVMKNTQPFVPYDEGMGMLG